MSRHKVLSIIGLVAVILATWLGGPLVAHAAESECTPDHITDRPWTADLFELDQLHEQATGRGVLVAIIDSGVDGTNPHLQDAIMEGASYLKDDASHGAVDEYGHGTTIAGIVAARKIDGSEVVGLAPDAKIISIRTFKALQQDEEGNTIGGPSLEDTAEGIRLATLRGAKVINVSLSVADTNDKLREAVTFAEQHGALVVASAGNRKTANEPSDGLRYPAAYPEVLGVTALDTSLQAPADDSISGPHVDVAAPGMLVASAKANGVDCTFSDTAASSYATAFVSAQAALIAEKYPNETPAQWRQRIKASANRSSPDQRNEKTGWGIIDPISSLTIELTSGSRGPDIQGTSGGNSMAAASGAEEAAILLRPLVDPYADLKLVVSLVTLGALAFCTIAWMIRMARQSNDKTRQL